MAQRSVMVVQCSLTCITQYEPFFLRRRISSAASSYPGAMIPSDTYTNQTAGYL